LTLDADGAFSYTPNSNFAGSDSFTYLANDGVVDSNITTVAITVTAVDDAPSISNIGDQSTDEDTPTGALSFTVGDAETSAGSLTVTGSSSNTTLVPVGGIVFGGSGANRTVTLTPAANEFGTTTIIVRVSDGTSTASDTFTLTVNSVNDAPTISNIADQTMWLGAALSLGAPLIGVEFSVGDVETLDGLILNGTSSNQALIPDAAISFGGSGSNRTVTLNPVAGQTGSATITVTVGDGELDAGDTFVLTVGVPASTVRIYSPNGGEKLFKKTTYVITWTAVAGAAPLASFNVLYSGDHGKTYAILPGCSNLGPTVHECKWTPAKVTSAGLVRVVATDRANNTGADHSDAPFSVVSGSPSISITAPKSGASWPIGSVRTISWKHNLGSDTYSATFTVEISRHGKDGSWETIASRVPQLSPTKGQFDWTVTGPTTKRAKLRVRSTTTPAEAISDSLEIVAPRLTVLHSLKHRRCPDSC
jgi:Big-like domain-containing protein